MRKIVFAHIKMLLIFFKMCIRDREACERLQPAAERKRVTLSAETEPILFRGVKQVLSEMIYNLCDNAIRYNKEGGAVFVTLKQKADRISLTVRAVSYTHLDVYKRQVYVTAGAIIVGVPLGILCAVFLVWFCPKRLYKIIKPAVELLAGIPSIV